jgi:ABC-type sulfate transport system substrate-binding protein
MVRSTLQGKRSLSAAADAYVRAVFENVVVQPRDAREASDVFYKQRVSACTWGSVGPADQQGQCAACR